MANVTLKLSIGSFAVEVTGPTKYAEKKLEQLVGQYLSSSVRSTPVETPSSIPLSKSGKQQTAAEFLKTVPHSNQIDRAIALGYYVEKRQSQPNFTSKEIGDLGRQTKYPFTNISDSLAQLVGRGLVMSAGEKDGKRAYALTATGEDYVESLISSKT